jgi:hypothetical protein
MPTEMRHSKPPGCGSSQKYGFGEAGTFMEIVRQSAPNVARRLKTAIRAANRKLESSGDQRAGDSAFVAADLREHASRMRG